MKGKYGSNKGLNAPGPGQYNPSLSRTQIQWSMGRDKRQEMTKD
eukprot:CAMPEP_0168313712 /NCGR_PEP_ID=MMETSP0210-20121227/3802_1 /TAXON_ID=40633 /ORGANISM="Condylostoma magnum, Strain COL2" /LENGTH=43 /DNA_ID= /DNA_START= /DNA_END= /DNA_ORIENTATION=